MRCGAAWGRGTDAADCRVFGIECLKQVIERALKVVYTRLGAWRRGCRHGDARRSERLHEACELGRGRRELG